MNHHEAMLDLVNTLTDIDTIAETHHLDPKDFKSQIVERLGITAQDLRDDYRLRTNYRAARMVHRELTAEWRDGCSINEHLHPNSHAFKDRHRAHYKRAVWGDVIRGFYNTEPLKIALDVMEREDAADGSVIYTKELIPGVHVRLVLIDNPDSRLWVHRIDARLEVFDDSGNPVTQPKLDLTYEYDLCMFLACHTWNYQVYDRPHLLPKIDPIDIDNRNPTMTTDFEQLISDAAVLLVETDKTVRDILSELDIKDHPKFYEAFRTQYQCTPTEYRRKMQELQREEEMREEAEEKQKPWQFTVSVETNRSTGMSPHAGMVMNEVRVIEIMVNEHYPYLVTLHTHQGKCPYPDLRSLIRSEHQPILNDQVLEVLGPYFHGRLDIAYGQGPAPVEHPNRFHPQQPTFGRPGGAPWGMPSPT
jgi:hypothetical protein